MHNDDPIMALRFIAILLQLLLLASCSQQGVILQADPGSAVAEEQVKVLLNERPACNYEVVAWLEIPGTFYDRSRLIGVFRSKAANLGADFVEITSLQKIGAIEYKGTARALRCVI